MNLELNVSLSSPVIFLKDPRDHMDRWVVLKLGTVSVSTDFTQSKQIANEEEVTVGKYISSLVIDVPVYTIGFVDFKLVTIVNLDDYHNWVESSNSTDIISNVAIMTKLSYKNLEPTSLAPTLDIDFEMSNINVYLSDFLVLLTIELIFGIQEAYNSHTDEAVGDSELEEAKIDTVSTLFFIFRVLELMKRTQEIGKVPVIVIMRSFKRKRRNHR